MKDTLLFDGECGFCRKWVNWVKDQTDTKVDYIAYQERPVQFINLSAENLAKAVHFVSADMKVSRAAEAIFEVLDRTPQRSKLLFAYRHVPFFATLAEIGYRFVASHRPFVSELTSLLFGERLRTARFSRVREIFLKILGLVYLSAFASMAGQITGLVGEHGILPAKTLIEKSYQDMGWHAVWNFPGLAWLTHTDAALVAYCVVGCVFSIFMILGFIPGLATLAAWLLWLSIVNVGNVFLSFQWDSLLLEAGFLALFLAPYTKSIRSASAREPRFTIIFLFRWLLFRLVFSSGLVKLASQDSNWGGLTALNFHFETQPLPTPLAWYFHHLPALALKFMTAGMFVIELGVPLCFFLPRQLRITAFWAQLILQVLIAISGNFAFFNLLTVGLSFFLLDDEYVAKFARFLRVPPYPRLPWRPAPVAQKVALTFVSFVVLFTGSVYLKSIYFEPGVVEKIAMPLIQTSEDFHLTNPYGLFAIMTTVRNELIIEGSEDEKTWLPYEFYYKPGDVNRAPAFIAPFQPRLDWQMWFASLGTINDQLWLQALLIGILDGKADTRSFFAANPFRDHPPRFVRVQIYEYHFTDGPTKKATGPWWSRTLKGTYCPTMSLGVHK